MRIRRLRSAALLILGLGALPALPACGNGAEPAPAETIDRETFVATYVDLRAAALAAPGGGLAPADRERILAQHGVSEQDLLEFADARGGDVAYMRDLWLEVEARLTPPAPDSAG